MGHDRIASAAKQPLWAVTIWDKKFNSVAPGKQKSAIKYHYLLAGDLKEKIVPGGDVKLLTTSETDWWTTEDKVVGLVSEGEIVSIPWGGNPNVQYFKGRFVTADNRIATSSDKGILDNKFLYYFMLSKRNTIGSFYRGAGLKHPEMSKVLDMEIPLPSIEVQRSFARCMDNVAKVIAIRKTQLESLSQLVKSRFVEMFGDPMSNPKGWPIGKVSDIARYWNGLTYKPEDVSHGGTIVLRSSNIQNGRLDFADTIRVALDAKEKNVVSPGDILMCSRNGSAALVGKTTIIPRLSEKMYFGAFMMVLRSSEPEYLNTFFKTKAFRLQIACGKTTTVNQITCSMMDRVQLPLPPLALQREFAAFVAKVDKLAFAARQRRDVAKKMYRAKIQEFFG